LGLFDFFTELLERGDPTTRRVLESWAHRRAFSDTLSHSMVFT
jgi:hypothetical protein